MDIIKSYDELEDEIIRRENMGIDTLVCFYGIKDIITRKKEIDLYVYVDDDDDGEIKRVFNITKTPLKVNFIGKITSIQHDDNKELLIKELKNNYNGDAVIPITATEGDALDKWTLADLFIRQYLNNGDDGFDMTQVEKMYHMLCMNKDLVIKYDLVSKDGVNNSGYTLWKNYGFDGHPFLTSIQHDDN